MMAKLTKVYNSGDILTFNDKTWTHSKNVSLFRSYVAFLGHRKVGI